MHREAQGILGCRSQGVGSLDGRHTRGSSVWSEGHPRASLIAALTRGVYAHGAEYFKLMIIGDGRAQHIPQCRSANTHPEFAGRCCGGNRRRKRSANLTAYKHMLLNTLKPGIGSRRVYELW